VPSEFLYSNIIKYTTQVHFSDQTFLILNDHLKRRITRIYFQQMRSVVDDETIYCMSTDWFVGKLFVLECGKSKEVWKKITNLEGSCLRTISDSWSGDFFGYFFYHSSNIIRYSSHSQGTLNVQGITLSTWFSGFK